MVITIHWLHFTVHQFHLHPPFHNNNLFSLGSFHNLSHSFSSRIACFPNSFICVFLRNLVCSSKFEFFVRKCSSIIHRPNVHFYYYSLLSSNHTNHENIRWISLLFMCPGVLLHQRFRCVKSFWLFYEQNNSVSARFMLKKHSLRLQHSKSIRMNVDVKVSNVEVSRDAYDFNILCI